jgi:hypothetical protein
VYRLNLSTNTRLFDGGEAALEAQSFKVSAGDGTVVSFSLPGFAANPLHGLRKYLQEAEFDQLIRDAGFRKGMGVVEQHVSKQNLELYYFMSSNGKEGKPFFVLVSFGEISPGRYVVQLEGLLE